MRVRRLLPLWIGAVPGAPRDEVGGFAEFAIFQNREDRNAVPNIICNQHMSAGLVDDDVAGGDTARTYLIQKSQPASRTIHRKRADPAAVPAVVVFQFVDRIQKSSIRRGRNKRRIRGFGGQAERRRLSRSRIQPEPIDATAPSAVFGVSANVEKILTWLGPGGR